MLGLMQDRPLALPHVFHRAEQLFAHKGVVGVDAAGIVTTTPYCRWAERVRRTAAALDALEVSSDGRVGTYCWNTPAHLELYFAVPCSGRVLHTLNIRLPVDQLVFVVEHAGDEVVFVDRALAAQLGAALPRLPGVRHVVVVEDASGAAVPDDPRILDHDTLLASVEPYPEAFVVDDENRAAALCYTSGTTGRPKGVLYSHRSTVLHALTVLTTDVAGLGERDTVLPVVPMFHANAWGYPYAAVLAGATLVLPGPDLSPASLARLLREQRATITAGVPTIWMSVLEHLAAEDVPALRMVLCGGSAVPISLSEGWREKVGVPITQGWGMTETSPMAAVGTPRSAHEKLAEPERAEVRALAGAPTPLVDLRIVDPDTGSTLPWDGTARGELQVTGPWVAASYYDPGGTADAVVASERHTADGWLRTGDVATLDAHGFVRLVDRTKDLVKSGGEWISSVDLENQIMDLDGVVEAAVIAIPDEKWSERPLACVVIRPGATLTREDVLAHLSDRVAKWQVPDDIVFLDEVPKTSTGKFSKKTLRERYAG